MAKPPRSSFDLSASFAQLIDAYLKLPLNQKILFPFLLALSVWAIVFVAQWANKADYVVLFSDLESADAGAVIERLKTMKVAYEVRGDGRTVAISPPEMVHEMRLQLASEGIPSKGTVGWEVFDGVSLGLTQQQEWSLRIRAKQGELERTIAALEAVQAVRVHISEPEHRGFGKNEQQATASVLLRLRAGGELDRKQIKGIANLVAGSVQGLKPENVTIIDSNGNPLTQSEEERKNELDGGGESYRIEYQRTVERGYIDRIEQMLQKVLGPGKAVARVTADIDYSSSEREEESYDPGGQVIRSERTIAEGTGASQRGGVPGVTSNLSNDPNLLSPPKSDGENSKRSESVKNYEVSRAITKSVAPRGSVVKLSAAVLVDGTYEEPTSTTESASPSEKPSEEAPAQEKETASQKKVFKPLDAETLARIEGIVKGAIGFDSNRGDSVTVESIPFYQPDQSLEESLKSAEMWQNIFGISSRILPALFVFIFIWAFVRPLLNFILTPSEAETDLNRLLPKGVFELEKELDAERTKATIPEFEPTIDLEQLEELMSENSRIVRENPQQAALLIRWWLNDGRL
jgi:flagellar M-ring protein FliF